MAARKPQAPTKQVTPREEMPPADATAGAPELPDAADPHLDEKATELLDERRHGDDHFPGDVNKERIHYNTSLNRRFG